MALRAGQEIDSFCTKCKMELLHKIVAVANDKPVKVECRTCKQVHMYRAVKREGGASSSSSASSGRAISAPRAAAVRRAQIEADTAVVPPSGARVHSYAMTEKYIADQWIVHRSFGNGHVLREVGADKIEVRFDSGVKTLVHNRAE